MTSTNTYTPIKPTYLYIKKCSITGLKYFGKTSKEDPYTYLGSGKHWVRNYTKYGKEHIVTLWVSDLYYDTSITEHALQFSYENNIVESDQWANLIFENGIDGTPSGTIFDDKVRENMSIWQKGKPKSDKHKLNISIGKTGIKRGKYKKETKPRSSKGLTRKPFLSIISNKKTYNIQA